MAKTARSDSMRSVYPPRLRDWREGKVQVAAFVRAGDGSTVAYASDDATETQKLLACLMVVSETLTTTQCAAVAKMWKAITALPKKST